MVGENPCTVLDGPEKMHPWRMILHCMIIGEEKGRRRKRRKRVTPWVGSLYHRDNSWYVLMMRNARTLCEIIDIYVDCGISRYV